MDRRKERELMSRKVEDCVRNDIFIAQNVCSFEEFEYYSDTPKVMAELADKYSLTLEELDRLWNYYDDFKEALRKK